MKCSIIEASEDFVDREKPLKFFELNMTRVDSTISNKFNFPMF